VWKAEAPQDFTVGVKVRVVEPLFHLFNNYYIHFCSTGFGYLSIDFGVNTMASLEKGPGGNHTFGGAPMGWILLVLPEVNHVFYEQATGMSIRAAYLLARITKIMVVRSDSRVDFLYDVEGVGSGLRSWDVLPFLEEGSDLRKYFSAIVLGLKFQLMGFDDSNNFTMADLYALTLKGKPPLIEEMMFADISTQEGMERFAKGILTLKTHRKTEPLISYYKTISGKKWEATLEKWAKGPLLLDSSGLTDDFYIIRKVRTTLWPWSSSHGGYGEYPAALVLFDRDEEWHVPDLWFKTVVESGRAAARAHDFQSAFLSSNSPLRFMDGAVRDNETGEEIVPPSVEAGILKLILGESSGDGTKCPPS